MHKKTGDTITTGESIATLYASDESLLANAAKAYIEAITIGETMPNIVDTILDIVEWGTVYDGIRNSESYKPCEMCIRDRIIACAIALCVGVGGGYYFFGTPAGTEQSVVTNQTKQTKPLTEARNTYVVQAAKKMCIRDSLYRVGESKTTEKIFT